MAAVMPATRTAPATTRGAIVIDDVVKIYDPQGAAVMAVDHCSLDINAGEICMIVGPSGCRGFRSSPPKWCPASTALAT